MSDRIAVTLLMQGDAPQRSPVHAGGHGGGSPRSPSPAWLGPVADARNRRAPERTLGVTWFARLSEKPAPLRPAPTRSSW